MINLFPKLPFTPNMNMIRSHVEKYLNPENYPWKKNKEIIYINNLNQLHRIDGPAIIWKDGTKCYYQNGLRHREDGPAVTYRNGDKKYYKHNKLHREDGPAIIWNDGRKVYYINRKLLTRKEFLNLSRK